MRHAGASTNLRFLPRDQILLCNWHPQYWWTSVQSADTCSSTNVAFSEYYACLTGSAKKRDVIKRFLRVDFIHTC